MIFFEHKVLYDEQSEVPDEAYTIPFGEANLTREGDDVTIVALGRMVQFANEAADALEATASPVPSRALLCSATPRSCHPPQWRHRAHAIRHLA